MSSFGFDVANTAPQAAFDPLPPGWYAMRINKAEMAPPKPGPTAADVGLMAKIEFEIIDSVHPEFANRKAFTRLCIHHKTNQETRKIARGQLSAIAHAIGRPAASTTDDLIGGELRVKLIAKPADGKFEASNECKGFKGLNDTAETPVAAGSATAAAATPATAAPVQPWKR